MKRVSTTLRTDSTRDLLHQARSALWLLLWISLYSNSTQATNCLYVSSYHHGYEWNDGIERGIEEVLTDKCTLDKYFMDTKRNNNEPFIEKSALAAKAYIEQT
ncbi:MAG: hypothetical protein FD130_2001, partial [Halothiobacillaceae bacterium]